MENRFGETLKQLRKEKKITQDIVSELIDVHRSNIANYENGRIFPSLHSLIKIAEYFDVSLDQLVFGTDHKIKSDANSEIMAENMSLMEVQLSLLEKVKVLEEENRILKEYNKALKQYNGFLENNQG